MALITGAVTALFALRLLTKAEPVVFNVEVKTTLFDVILFANAVPVTLSVDVLTSVFAVILSVTICLCIIALFATCNVNPGASKYTLASNVASPPTAKVVEMIPAPRAAVFVTDKPVPIPFK